MTTGFANPEFEEQTQFQRHRKKLKQKAGTL